jgi:hypothetical protein
VVVKGKPLDSLLFHTPEGITVKPLYSAADVQDADIAQGKRAIGDRQRA